MNRKIILIGTFFLIGEISVEAQSLLNEKSYYDSLKPKKVIGDMGLGLNINDEENRKIFFLQNASVSYASKRHLYEFSNDLYFNQNGTDRESNRMRSLLRIAFLRQKFKDNRIISEADFFPEVNTAFMYDESRGLNYRFSTSLGISYNLHTLSWGRFKAGTGLMYEKESWRIFEHDFLPTYDTLSPVIKSIMQNAFGINSKGNIVKDNWRWNSYVQFLFVINDKINISAVGSLQIPIKVPYENPYQIADLPIGNKKYPRITLDLNTSFDISSKLNFFINLFLQKDEGQISPFAKKSVLNFSQGLAYKF